MELVGFCVHILCTAEHGEGWDIWALVGNDVISDQVGYI